MVKYVEFTAIRDGNIKKIGEVRWVDGKMQYRGLPATLIDDMKENGIRGRKGKLVGPDQGVAFLKQLKHQFTGAYFRAGDVKEKKK